MKKRGTTLIEILFYAGLLTIVLGLITNFLYSALNFKVRNQIQSALFQNIQEVVTKISQDIRRTESVTTPVNESFTNSLILQTQEGQITFVLDEGVLKRNNLALTDQQVEVIIDPPNRGFRRIGDSIQMKIRLKAKLKPFGQPYKEYDYQTTIKLP